MKERFDRFLSARLRYNSLPCSLQNLQIAFEQSNRDTQYQRTCGLTDFEEEKIGELVLIE
jgi:hypothetical protein